MNVCRFSESIWYISHLLIIHVEWAKISWLSYHHVCPTLISQTFCKWGYYAINKAEWTSAVWRASEKRGPHSYTCHLQTRLHYGFQRGNIAPSPLRQCLSLGTAAALWLFEFAICDLRIQSFAFHSGVRHTALPGLHFRWEEENN